MSRPRTVPFRALIGLLAAGLLWAGPVPAAAPAVRLSLVASGTGQPVAVRQPEDGSDRLFVLDRQGAVRIVADGRLQAQPYLRVQVSTRSEQGLLGMAFDPDFARNGVFYLTYTAPAEAPRLGRLPDQVLARYTARDPAANVFAGRSEVLLRIPDLYANHNGGDIHFGPDGYLYWGTGDGGSGGDPNGFARNLWKKPVEGKSYYLLGKMLRLDVRHGPGVASAETCGGTPGQALPYRIPPDNPYRHTAQACDEIFHSGLRNPWRFSFDPRTGAMIIADVGQNAWEEINVVAAGMGGRDFGWNCFEGAAAFEPQHCSAATPRLSAPVFVYSHEHGCSITGGAVYRGPHKALDGWYFYGDFCRTGLYWADADAARWHAGGTGVSGVPQATGVDLHGPPAGFGRDRAGNLYVTLLDGRVYRIEAVQSVERATRSPAGD